MGKIFSEISNQLAEWIGHQKMFFVATAPLSASGHINCSPKGLDSFRILNPAMVAYQDLTGSGIETIAHINENKRIVIMFCAFDGPPKIVRLYGEGEAVTPAHPDFDVLLNQFPKRKSTRAFVRIKLTRIADSCGYGVPLYEFKKDRDVLDKWAEAKGEEGIIDYQKQKNLESIDHLAGLNP